MGRALEAVCVLVVDDDVDAREMLAMFLGEHGARVVTAKDGAEAIALLEPERPNVVLTDLAMRSGDGYDVFRAVREVLGSIPCIAISALPDDGRAREAGFDLRMEKPIDLDDLLEAIRRTLGPVRQRRSGVRATPRRTRRKKTG